MILMFLLIVLFVIVTFYYYLSKSKKYDFFEVQDIFPELQKIHDLRTSILQEVDLILNEKSNWEYWPEKELYDGVEKSSWKIFPFFAFGEYASRNCEKAPVLTQFIKNIPNVKLATLSKLSPGMKLKPHRGWGSHSNHVIRCHYGIIVPENACYIDVNNKRKFHKNDEWIVFDDSEEHFAENMSKNEDRIVLIVDIERPKHIQKGTSDGSETKELQNIINYYKQMNK